MKSITLEVRMKKQSIYRWLRHVAAIATCCVASLAQASEQQKLSTARCVENGSVLYGHFDELIRLRRDNAINRDRAADHDR